MMKTQELLKILKTGEWMKAALFRYFFLPKSRCLTEQQWTAEKKTIVSHSCFLSICLLHLYTVHSWTWLPITVHNMYSVCSFFRLYVTFEKWLQQVKVDLWLSKKHYRTSIYKCPEWLLFCLLRALFGTWC